MTRNADPRLQDTPARIDPVDPDYFDAESELLDQCQERALSDWQYEMGHTHSDAEAYDDQ